MMLADGGEAWSVTSHKGGVSGFHFSPDGKRLVLSADRSAEQRRRGSSQEVKDDTM
jgi:Tol biopolymer transport system component